MALEAFFKDEITKKALGFKSLGLNFSDINNSKQK